MVSKTDEIPASVPSCTSVDLAEDGETGSSRKPLKNPCGRFLQIADQPLLSALRPNYSSNPSAAPSPHCPDRPLVPVYLDHSSRRAKFCHTWTHRGRPLKDCGVDIMCLLPSHLSGQSSQEMCGEILNETSYTDIYSLF